MAKTAEFKLPKTLGACADLLYTLREERLILEREADQLKERETIVREHLIQELPKSEASGVAGKIARASVVTKRVPRVIDWDLLYKHVKKTGQFDLLQRRLSDAAVKERWEHEHTVPGVEPYQVVTVALNKV